MWVKVLGFIALILVLLLIVLLLTRGTGGHGPARHLSWGSDDDPSPVLMSSLDGAGVGDRGSVNA